MEVLETKQEAEARVSHEQEEEAITKKVIQAFKEAQDKLDAKHTSDTIVTATEDAKAEEVDVDKHVENSKVLKTLRDNDTGKTIRGVDSKSRTVSVTQKEKDVFLASVVAGTRYTETRPLLNGRLNVTFRSRSALESSAIDAYIQHEVAARRVKSEHAYADLMRFCVLAAGVQSVNDDVFPTLAEAAETSNGMFYAETEKGRESPKWLWLLDKWKNKPESLVAVLIEAYFDFEAKYWLMINNSSVENFWNPGESTGN